MSFLLLVFLNATGQFNSFERYADTVLAYSSQYTTTSWAAYQITGKPNAWPNCGDQPQTWASQTANEQREYLVAGFYNPQPVRQIRIYQTVATGGIDTVYLRNAANQQWTVIYTATATDVNAGGCTDYQQLRERLTITLPDVTAYNVDAVRIAINSPAVPYYQEIDAVSLLNPPSTPFGWEQYADSVISYSSSYNSSIGDNAYSPERIKGKPTQFGCNDSQDAWCPATTDGQREFIEMYYRFPAAINGINIYQNYKPGGVDTIYARNANTNTWSTIYSRTAVEVPCAESVAEFYFALTSYPVDAIRLAINSPEVPVWQEFDAVGLLTNLPATAKKTAKSGDWNNPATWLDNTVPAATDVVYIGTYHQVNVTANTTCRKLFLLKGALVKTLTGKTLTITE